jgi:hypothetical protein
MKFLTFVVTLSMLLAALPRRAHADYKCSPNLAVGYCKFATQCVAAGHHVWERQFADWLCYDEHGKMKRKQCKESAKASEASGVIDFHHFADGTCYFVFGKKG